MTRKTVKTKIIFPSSFYNIIEKEEAKRKMSDIVKLAGLRDFYQERNVRFCSPACGD